MHAADSRCAHAYTCTFMFSTSARTFEYSNVVVCSVQSKMPNPYSMDLRWRVVWLSITYHYSSTQIAQFFNLSERTVRRYIATFQQTGDVEVKQHQHGPPKLLGEFEQLTLLQIILQNPGIYLQEVQTKLPNTFGVQVSVSNICKTLKYMGCTRQTLCHVAKQRDDQLRAKFMADISIFDLIWLDETGCDKWNIIRKYGYSIRGRPLCDQRLLVRGTRYSAIPIVSLNGILDVYLTEGTMNGERFAHFVRDYLLPSLLPFNGVNPRSVVIMDNASIHHVEEVRYLIEVQAGAKLVFLPPYSPDLMPAEGVFSQVKSLMKLNDQFFQACADPRSYIALLFGMITVRDCYGHMDIFLIVDMFNLI